MHSDMAFKDFSHIRWLSRNNSISGRTSFKTNSMFTLLTNLGTFSGGYTAAHCVFFLANKGMCNGSGRPYSFNV